MPKLKARLHAIRFEALDINSFEFHAMPGAHLPRFSAGSHIDVHLPNGLLRSYSLSNSPSECHRYVITVKKGANSRGGSRFMHEQLQVGSTLPISGPRNNFSLNEAAEHTVLIAGGIGITPLRSMISRLNELSRSWELHYAARNRDAAAYLGELDGPGNRVPAQCYFNFDPESGGHPLDLLKVVRSAPEGSHFYCCGPLSMLTAFEAATADLPSHRVHLEYFVPRAQPSAIGGFKVQLARSDRVIEIPYGKTILDVLLEIGVSVPYSCTEGVCAACETQVLSGIPDHHDLVLSNEERGANDRMMICCSGAKSELLVLDL